jgi:H+-translocating NAD(P) transhydrogenase subunit alpha
MDKPLQLSKDAQATDCSSTQNRRGQLLITVPKESASGETRVAATPETVKKFKSQGHTVKVESGAGLASSNTDEAYATAGADITDRAGALGGELVLKVRAPQADELAHMKRGQVLIGMLEPFNAEGLAAMNAAGLTAFAMEAAPRISRAQSLDVLSSQANVAGYKAVLMGANAYGKLMPMMMTAAGTVKAARVVILGVGVAGLQAIATAKRLGAVVEASDVRPATKEQVESLGGKFIDVPFETDEEREIAQGTGGYARPMPEAWMKRQAALVAERLKQCDIAITTALIPGRPAPRLISAEVVQGMKPGSVIVDMAAERGGNCELTEPGKTVVKHGVTIVGAVNIPATVPTDSSALYARNLLDFMKLIINKDASFYLNLEDEIVAACLMCHGGELKRGT